MDSPLPRGVAATAALVLLGSMHIGSARAEPAAQGPGDLWEVTTQMSMEEMPMAMPSNTQRVCSSKEWKEPPAAMDRRQKCESSEFKVDGSKVSWKVSCAGPPAMTGTGEITRDGLDAYVGTIKFASSDGNMTIKLSGRRVGDCDPAAKQSR